MKKRTIAAAVLALMILSALPLTVVASAAAYDLSPGLAVIQNGVELKKCSLINNSINFKPEDFESTLGVKRVDFITVTSLPDPAQGTLQLAGIDVLAGQAISRDSISSLAFVPTPDTACDCVFTFENTDISTLQQPTLSPALANTGDTAFTSAQPEFKCELYVLDTLNFAPQAGAVSVKTQSGVAVFKSMQAADPEGNALTFMVTSPPKHGSLLITDAANGNFRYTPVNGYTGKDSFVYEVADQYGNVSVPATVSINVQRRAADIDLTDMTNNWAANAAIRAVAANLMTADSSTGQLMFDPGLQVSRGEFLEAAMKAAGMQSQVSKLGAVTGTGFTDDASIPLGEKPYVALAQQLGIVSGYTSDSGAYFDPNGPISRMEAAVLIDKLLKLPATDMQAATSTQCMAVLQSQAVPAWAQDALVSLQAANIMNSSSGYSGQDYVDRAQMAQILCNIIDYGAGTL